MPVVKMVFEAVFWPDGVFLHGAFHLFIQTTLVFLQCQYIIAFAFRNFCRYLLLAPSGISADGVALQVQYVQQERDSGDFIAFCLSILLRKHHPMLMGESRDNLEAFQIMATTAAQRFAISAYLAVTGFFSRSFLSQHRRMSAQQNLNYFRSQQREYAPERPDRGNAVGKFHRTR